MRRKRRTAQTGRRLAFEPLEPRCLLTAEILGTVWHDSDGDGVRGAEEPGLPGWTAFWDRNGNLTLDEAVDRFVATDVPKPVPDADFITSTLPVTGLNDRLAGVQVTFSIQHTYDSDLSAVLVSPQGTRVELFHGVGGSGDGFDGTTLDDEAADSISTGVAPFAGRFRPAEPLSSLAGQNPNGRWWLEVADSAREDSGTLLAWSLHLTIGERRTAADANGQFQFLRLAPATYRVAQTPQAGWVSTYPDGSVAQEVALQRGSVVRDRDFGRRVLPGSLGGTTWSDHNGNGRREPEEPWLAGWTVYLDADGNGQLDEGEPTAATDAEGRYSFAGLTPGVHRVREVVQEGWQQTFPGEGTVPASSQFDVELVFPAGGLSAAQRATVEQAARRWSEVIVGDVPDVGDVDDVRIEVRTADIDGVGGVLGRAGPTQLRPGSSLPYRGFMEFDSQDITQLEADGRWAAVVRHEIAHVLGFGTVWDDLRLLTGEPGDPRFAGAQATAEYNAAFGRSESGVPVENTGGAGTERSHWREQVFGAELMTGFVGSGAAPLSRITAASLADLGYQVDLRAADPYSPPAETRAVRESLGRIVAVPPPREELDAQGDESGSQPPPSAPVRAAIRRAANLAGYSKEQLAAADRWLVHLADDAPHTLAAALGISPERLEPAAALPGAYLLHWPSPAADVRSAGQQAADALARLAAEKILDWYYPVVQRQRTRRSIPNDPLFEEQWNLRNTGQTGGVIGMDARLSPAWEWATGLGVTIGIVDDGLEYTHPDLTSRYRPEWSYDFVDGDSDPAPSRSAAHGTAVAGIAAAAGNSGLGISGAAPAADLAAIRLLGEPGSDSEEAAALSYGRQQIGVYNCSWGPPDDGKRLEGPGPLTLAAIEQGVLQGRGGRGSIYVFAGGNGRGSGDNVNYDGYANSRYTIAVAAIDHRGVQASYSEPGAPLLVSAPSSGDGTGITSTDLLGDDGQPGDYVHDFGGTSAAAPLVSGVVALMLEANPDLSWRDVQQVLVRTARQNDVTDADWVVNGGGHPVNHKYGFGTVDALAAVQVARSWHPVSAEHAVTSGPVIVGRPIPDDEPAGASSAVTLAESLTVEWVEVVLDASHPSRGNLEVVLTSPSGTQSVLAEVHGDADADYEQWVFTSARHWMSCPPVPGRSPCGTWSRAKRAVSSPGS